MIWIWYYGANLETLLQRTRAGWFGKKWRLIMTKSKRMEDHIVSGLCKQHRESSVRFGRLGRRGGARQQKVAWYSEGTVSAGKRSCNAVDSVLITEKIRATYG